MRIQIGILFLNDIKVNVYKEGFKGCNDRNQRHRHTVIIIRVKSYGIGMV